jgi:hypothetical protein
MEKEQFLKVKSYQNPIDWFNQNATKEQIQHLLLKKDKDFNMVGRTIEYDETFYTPTEFVCLKSKLHWSDIVYHVQYLIWKWKINYIRVGCDYFRVLEETNRYGVKVKKLKGWKKDELKDEFGKGFVKMLPKYEDFIIVPDNKNHQEVIDSKYNLYNPFPHKASVNQNKEFPHIESMLLHIFGEQIELGYKYMKILYEYPKQRLPILVLTSKERETGKTTFMNFLHILFGENYVNISPQDLASSFNETYAKKNIVAIDEAVVEKSVTGEKLKNLATAPTLVINTKFVQQYSVPFYGKIIMATNKVRDFMKIDEEEIRYWVRDIPHIGKKVTDIENKMRDEIPYFLEYLEGLPEIDFSKSRMVFTKEEIRTSALDETVIEGESELCKDLKERLESFFFKSGLEEFEAKPINVLKFFYDKNSRITVKWIGKVLRDELKLEKTKLKRFVPFGGSQNDDGFSLSEDIGEPYIFKRNVIVMQVLGYEVTKNETLEF